MRVFRNPEVFQRKMDGERRRGRTLGLVPTMGALHEAHLSLVRAARKENDKVAVSIFVNPLQFGPKEDFSKYPRTFAKDRKMLVREGVDYLFYPSSESMYPKDAQTYVDLSLRSGGLALTEGLCGKFRPGHFRGVATVVTKLFNLARPHRVYFGAKDFQQAVIVERVLKDLNFGIRMRRMPLIRERDGLAMSSRNRYLSPQERARALEISKTLFELRDRLKTRTADLPRLLRQARAKLKRIMDKVDYLEAVDPQTLGPVSSAAERPMLIAAACYVGKTRLIDNVIIPAFAFRRRKRQ